MKKLPELFANNRRWAAEMVARDPDFFAQLTAQQAPAYLWIGCSDSRVPANQIVGLEPGQMFVHRNVANVVIPTDLNCLSVLQYAVDVLRVRHLIVCGHYGCGGVQAALAGTKLGLIDNWLHHVQEIRRKYARDLEALGDLGARADRLCELNVLEQAVHVGETTIVQDAWARGQDLTIHGWIYRLDDGLLRDLGFCVTAPDEVPAALAKSVAALGLNQP
ncbi:MAG TPA: carbonate dehydratase [Thermoanaerobaculia bacterium]|nr:carbonate dehydratase [Thermoanaerobaculia bacterium]